MVSVNEFASSQSAFASAMRQGLEAIDRDQTVTFTQYQRAILPADGYLFWIKTPNTITVDGSLHYSINKQQNETETVSVNQVLFTAEREIEAFSAIRQDSLWIGDIASSEGPPCECDDDDLEAGQIFPIKFAFSSRGGYYKQADIYHYVGTAVLPAMMSQLIENPASFPATPIVSNSLPIWLAQSRFGHVYPSFMVPSNLEPPYIVAHIEPGGTEAVQHFPDYTPGFLPNSDPPPAYVPGVPIPDTGTAPLYHQKSRQLASDRVRLTLIGFDNQRAQKYLSYLMQNSMDLNTFGFQNSPIIRDEKVTQVELATLQQRKTIEIVASYYQGAADVIAQRLITEAIASISTPMTADARRTRIGESPAFRNAPSP